MFHSGAGSAALCGRTFTATPALRSPGPARSGPRRWRCRGTRPPGALRLLHRAAGRRLVRHGACGAVGMGTGTGTGTGVGAKAKARFPQPALLETAVAAHAVLPAPSFPPGAAPPRPRRRLGSLRRVLWRPGGPVGRYRRWGGLAFKNCCISSAGVRVLLGLAGRASAGEARSACGTAGRCRRLRFPEVFRVVLSLTPSLFFRRPKHWFYHRVLDVLNSPFVDGHLLWCRKAPLL